MQELEVEVFACLWIGGLSAFFMFKVLIMYFSFLAKGKRSKKWLKTNGIVIKSEIEIVMNGDVLDSNFSIIYEFYHNDMKYCCDKIFFKTFDDDYKNYKKKYPLNKIVNVYFNPENPTDAVLEPGIPQKVHLLLFIALLPLSGIIVSGFKLIDIFF
jgi:hypothetical protein